ncbi:uncharacterized protein LOC123676975 [Harmonia axyridis]|uniref:uncharacterized protein LOC123676975 n=1 Tax=Harmonia axyridis TaxID=115357 RepID=UPI001E275149|nr:uncharacterized protein LOC123676975 [Harmonia axyridis]
MALPTHFIKIGELLEESAETENDNLILERLKLLAQENLPEGWTEWKVAQLTKEQVLGNPVDPLVLNKIRFALPTLGVVRAFSPEADHLSEKTYRDIKMSMLEWAFCRALIMSPPFVSNRIRGSAAQSEIFNQAVRDMKPLLISRQEASGQLGEKSEAGSEEEMSEDSHGKRRRYSSKEQVVKRPRLDRVALLENKVDTMFASICARLDD